MNPLLSVHITTYNHVGFIEEAIESVLAKDHSPLQIILGDDGSSDGSGAVVERYAQRFADLTAGSSQPGPGGSRFMDRAMARISAGGTAEARILGHDGSSPFPLAGDDGAGTPPEFASIRDQARCAPVALAHRYAHREAAPAC